MTITLFEYTFQSNTWKRMIAFNVTEEEIKQMLALNHKNIDKCYKFVFDQEVDGIKEITTVNPFLFDENIKTNKNENNGNNE